MAADHVDLLIRESLIIQLIRIAVMMLLKFAFCFFSDPEKKAPPERGVNYNRVGYQNFTFTPRLIARGAPGV